MMILFLDGMVTHKTIERPRCRTGRISHPVASKPIQDSLGCRHSPSTPSRAPNHDGLSFPFFRLPQRLFTLHGGRAILDKRNTVLAVLDLSFFFTFPHPAIQHVTVNNSVHLVRNIELLKATRSRQPSLPRPQEFLSTFFLHVKHEYRLILRWTCPKR